MSGRLARIVRSDAPAGRLARYVVAGGSAAVVDLGGFLALLAAGLPVWAAAAGSFAAAAAWNFALSSRIVFRMPPTLTRAGLFAAAALVGLVVNTGATVTAALWLPEAFAKVAGIGVAFGANFWMNDAVVFTRRRGSGDG